MKTINFDKVADLYDLYVNADFDIPLFLEEARKAGGKILELMCGTGRVSVPLIEKGIDLTCVDYSQGMLDVFRSKLEEKNLQARLVHMDVTQLSLDEKFPLVLLPFNSFSEIFDPEKAKEALKAIRRHMDENSTFICTLQNPVVRLETVDGQMRVYGRFPGNEGGSVILSYYNNFDTDTHIVTGQQFYEIYDENNIMSSKRHIDINFRLYYKEEFEELFEECGFRAVKVCGNYDYTDFYEELSPYMIWFLKWK